MPEFLNGIALKDAKVGILNILAIDGRGYGAPDAKEAITDDNGVFKIEGLPTGYAQLMAQATGYHFDGLSAIYDVPGTDIVLQLARAGGLVVNVTDKDGKPLTEFDGNPLLINVEPRTGFKNGAWMGGGVPKADGSFEFTDVPPGEYRIICRPNPSFTNIPFAPEHIIAVKAGERATVKIIHE